MDKERAIQIVEDYENLRQKMFPITIEAGLSSMPELVVKEGKLKLFTIYSDYEGEAEIPEGFIEGLE